MTVELQALQVKVEEALSRIQSLEERLRSAEGPVARWQFLVARSHPWRRQLYIKGRNLTVGQLMSTLRANRLSAEQAAEDLELPLGAVQEALHYYEENWQLIQLEAQEERRRLAEQGVVLESQHLPR
jgi:uncharacterized protein (DUF433 family)